MATVGFGLESANVVGYTETGLLSNGQAKGVGSAFVNVDNTDMTLANLTVVGYDTEEGYADMEIQAQQLTGGGATLNGMTYYWCDFEEDGVKYYGWYDENMNDYNSLPLIPGEGWWIYSSSDNYKIQTAGAVSDKPITVPLLGGAQAKLVSNPMPTSLDLGQVVIKGYNAEEGYADMEIQAQQLTGGGATLNGMTYYWCDFEEDGVTYYGWYDENMNDYNSLELGSSEALWVYSPSSSLYVEFPSPL